MFLKYAKEIKALGYKVYVNNSDFWYYGFIVNDKEEIGYFQLGDYGHGISFSTIHYGTKYMGRGFSLDEWDKLHEHFTREIVDRCFARVPRHCYEPGWCKSEEELKDLERVKKYTATEYLSTKDNIIEL